MDTFENYMHPISSAGYHVNSIRAEEAWVQQWSRSSYVRSVLEAQERDTQVCPSCEVRKDRMCFKSWRKAAERGWGRLRHEPYRETCNACRGGSGGF